MIPMRDDVKLFTVIMTPIGATKPLPVLIQRTPYGADIDIEEAQQLILLKCLIMEIWLKMGTFLYSRIYG